MGHGRAADPCVGSELHSLRYATLNGGQHRPTRRDRPDGVPRSFGHNARADHRRLRGARRAHAGGGRRPALGIARLWIRAELTFAALIGFILGVLSIRGSVGRVRAVRGWITLGLGLWLLARAATGLRAAGRPRREPRAHHPAIDRRPGLRRTCLRGRPQGQLGRSEELTVYLDGAIIFFATAALILTTSAEAADASVANAIYLGHAIFFLGLSGATLLLDLTVRAERRAAWGIPDPGGDGPARGRVPR